MEIYPHLGRNKTSRSDEKGLHGCTVAVQIANLLFQYSSALSDSVEGPHVIVPHRAGGIELSRDISQDMGLECSYCGISGIAVTCRGGL